MQCTIIVSTKAQNKLNEIRDFYIANFGIERPEKLRQAIQTRFLKLDSNHYRIQNTKVMTN